MLVSAYHDIVGGTSQDGLGEVVMQNSDDTYRLGRSVDTSMAAGTTADTNIPVALTAGQRVKVAIAWDANSNGSTTDTLTTTST